MDHHLCVRGVNYRLEQAAQVAVGDQVAFRPEPGNEHDPQAIAVLTLSAGQWQQIGYVPKELTGYLRPLLPEEATTYAYPGAHVCEVKREQGRVAVWIRFSASQDMPRQSPLRPSERPGVAATALVAG